MTEDGGELELTDEQQAALTLDWNVAITAGAGTGKTMTLTERYVRILEENPSLTPSEIATITFTRKAAAELTEKVRERVYEHLATAESPESYHRWRVVLDTLEDGYVHTIHGFCTRLLRERAVAAPVPMGFDVLDEIASARLQREVVIEFLEHNQDDEDVALLAQLWGRSQLVDVLSGLLDDRPRSKEVLEHWRDATPEEYVDVLWEVACELDGAAASETLFEEGLLEELRALQDRLETADDIDDEGGLDALRELLAVCETLSPEPEMSNLRQCQQAILILYEVCEKKNGGLYSSSGYIVGDRSDWGDHTDLYDDLSDTLDGVIEAVDPFEDAVETTPGELEANSAHYALALFRVFEAVLEDYTAEKERRNALDFPDVIETTIELLRNDETVRQGLQEQFAHVMVDEFQDTDPRQWELVKLLTGVDENTASNVFLVGDEKQSIYGFRGADVTTFGTARDELQAVNREQGVDTVLESDAENPTSLELSGNFRTLDTPLSFINELFERLLRPNGEEHADYESPPQRLSMERDRAEAVGELTGSVEYLLVPDDADTATALLGEDNPVAEGAPDHTIEGEARGLAGRLTHLLADPPTVQDLETGDHREATPSDVAILIRRRTHLDRYQRALEEHDIPYTVVGGTGFYDTPEVQALTNLLRVLGDPRDDISLYGVLRSPLFGFTDDRLATAIADADSVWDALAETDDPQLVDAFDLIRTWRRLSGCDRPVEGEVLQWDRLLSRVIDDTCYLASVSADERGRQAVANVEKFRDQVRDWSESGVQTPAGLLHRIDRLTEIDPREGEADIPGDVEGVRIMTIHAAKGLEFPIVTVPDLGSKLGFGRSIDDHGYVSLVDGHGNTPPLPAVGGPDPTNAFSREKTAAHEYAARQTEPKERAEAKRLLYVACTRARDHLLLCGTHEINVGEEGDVKLGEVAAFEDAERWRDWLQPVLLDDEELLTRVSRGEVVRPDLNGARYTVRMPPKPVDWQTLDESEETMPAIDIPSPPERPPAARVTATTLVEAVADYDEDESSTTDIEPDELSSTTFGTVVHRILELQPPRDEWESTIHRLIRMQGEEPSEQSIRGAIEHVEDAVSFLESLEADTTVEATHDEYSVTAQLGQIRIVGDIDRLYVLPETYDIVDYKTNDVTVADTGEYAEHYRPQLLAYALALLQHDPSRNVRASLRFTDAGVEECFGWSAEALPEIGSELRSMVGQVDRVGDGRAERSYPVSDLSP